MNEIDSRLLTVIQATDFVPQDALGQLINRRHPDTIRKFAKDNKIRRYRKAHAGVGYSLSDIRRAFGLEVKKEEEFKLGTWSVAKSKAPARAGMEGR